MAICYNASTQIGEYLEQKMDIGDLPPKNLDIMSIDALLEYITELEAEIARARETIKAKEKAKSEALSAFKR